MKTCPTKDDTPKTWGEMTPEEKGALLLAAHEKRAIQMHVADGWVDCIDFGAVDGIAYRIRPEFKLEKVTLYGRYSRLFKEWVYDEGHDRGGDTHRLTFNLIDGKPDCASVRMERIND